MTTTTSGDRTVYAIGPGHLETDLTTAADDALLAQQWADSILDQPILDLPVDTGLAARIGSYQSLMHGPASHINSRIMPGWIRAAADALAFTSLWEATAVADVPLIEKADEVDGARAAAAHGVGLLSESAGDAFQRLRQLESEVSVVSAAATSLQKKLDEDLGAAIGQLDANAAVLDARIDAIKTAINGNIDDIVAGATEVGGALTELGVGVLTTIQSGTGANPKGDGSKSDGKSTPPKSDDDSGDKKIDKPSKGEVPDTSFAVASIQAATQGAEKTAAARAALNSNNEKLATAYQELARISGVTAIVKSLQVQLEFFCGIVARLPSDAGALKNDWGCPPTLGTPSGIAGALGQFQGAVLDVESSSDAAWLASQVRANSVSWTSLAAAVQRIKGELAGVDAVAPAWS